MIRQSKNQCNAALSGICLGILLLGFSDTARAQTVTVSGVNGTTLAANNVLNVIVQQGGASSVQDVQVNTEESGQAVAGLVTVQISQSAPWLLIAQVPTGTANLNVPAGGLVLQITVNAANLKQGTQPSGLVTITPPTAPSNAVTLTVNVTVSGTSLLSSNPSSLSFSAAVGAQEVNVPTQQTTISSSGEQLSYTVSVSTQNGLPWLIPSPQTGTTGSSTTDIITVGVNPAGLAVNTYQGTITVQSTTTQDAVVIAVMLTVTPNTTLSVTPAALQPFLFQVGTAPVPGQLTQTLQVGSSNSSQAIFEVTMSPVVSWLVISPTSGATGTSGQAVPVTLTVNPTGLGAADYTTSITVGIVGGTPLASIPVELVVSTNPLLSLSQTTLGFASPFGATTPPASESVQVTTLGNSNTPVSFTVSSDETWLNVTESTLLTPSTLTISVSPASLAVGSYTGHIKVTPNNSDVNLYSLTITVSLTVGNAATVTAGPPLAIFAWETSEPAPQPQVIELFTTGQATTFSLTASVTTSSSCPAGWLNATTTSASTQNATITVTATVTGMSPGVCPGTVTVSYPTNSLAPQTLMIPVVMNVSNSALLNISLPLGFGDVTAAQGANQVTQNIGLTSTDQSTPVTDIVTSSSGPGPAPWLFFGQSGSSTPQTAEVIYNPGSLPSNTYAGSITISSSKLPSSPLSIPVILTVTSSITVTASPTTLNFTEPSGGPLPSAQDVTLTSSATGATFQVSVPSAQACSWLQVTPTSGPASGPVAFSVMQNSLPQSTNPYQCPVTISFLNSATASITVTANLTVGPAQTLTVAPTSLTFAYQLTGSAPASQPLTVASTGGSVAFTAAANSASGWLSIDTTTSATGTSGSKVINVSVNPADFPAGTTGGSTLQGTVTISSTILSSPLVVNVTVNVTAAPVPTPVTIINSAIANGFGAVAPGELIAIKGTNLGPSCSGSSCVAGGYTFTVNSGGTVSSTLQGVSVTFNGTAGTPTYVSPTQINVIVPWEVAAFASVQMIVSYNTVQSAAFALQVAAVAPGIFTQNATGAGQAAAENVNTSLGSALNGPAGGTYIGTSEPTAPAPQGSTVVLYLTGGGLTNPAGVDGTLNSSTTLMPLKNWTSGSNTVTATIANVPATVEFAGAVPTLITGVIQVNLQVPTGVSGPALPVVITIDGQATQTTATIAVQ